MLDPTPNHALEQGQQCDVISIELINEVLDFLLILSTNALHSAMITCLHCILHSH